MTFGERYLKKDVVPVFYLKFLCLGQWETHCGGKGGSTMRAVRKGSPLPSIAELARVSRPVLSGPDMFLISNLIQEVSLSLTLIRAFVENITFSSAFKVRHRL
ncbi:unnamed protein product [Boreogadus saida]